MPANAMYQTMMYGYRSGLNATMTNHLHSLVRDVSELVQLKEGDAVLDIGSNDATLLKGYSVKGLKKLGIDPTGKQFKEHYTSDIELIPDFFTKEKYNTSYADEGRQKAAVVTSISMFYDLPHPLQFMKDVRDVMDINGVWVMEQSYMPTMLARQSFDTICHEHLEYYGLRQIQYMAERADLRILKVEFNDCNGGSFRVTLCHQDSERMPLLADELLIDQVLESEAHLTTLAPYVEFMDRCNVLKEKLKALVNDILSKGKTIYLYGASTKGNTLLQYYGIDHTHLTAAAERNPDKYGCVTPATHIPIESEAAVRAARPDAMLVLPWHFKAEFLEREKDYLRNGGCFIFPLPEISTVEWNPKQNELVTNVL